MAHEKFRFFNSLALDVDVKNFFNFFKKNWKYSFTVLLSGFLLISFQNCGKFDLQKIPVVMASYGFDISGVLESPTKVRSHTRLVFAIDQSQSMALMGCNDDLDGPNPSINPGPCNAPPGPDAVGRRFEVVRLWLEQLRLKDEPDVLVMILPFSGGFIDANRKLNEMGLLGFMKLSDAITRLRDLKTEQDQEIQNPNRGPNDKKMGTTVPYGFLSYAQGKIEEEMRKLLAEKQLYTSLFEFYYISDGLYKPNLKEIKTAMDLAKCPMECVLDPEYIQCNSVIGTGQVFDGNGNLLTSRPATAEMIAKAKICAGPNAPPTAMGVMPSTFSGNACYCLTIGNTLYKYLGRHEDNDPAKNITTLMSISGLADYFMQGNINMNFVSVLPLSTVTPPGAINIFNDYKKMIPQARLTTLEEMEKVIPRSAVPLQVLSYKIDKFYVVNLNAAQAENGMWISDSDADGISDDDEVLAGLDPLNERSSPDAPYCLDGLNAKFGCRMSGCDPTLDVDGDFLNECEEKTLKTATNRRDTTDDGIIDYIKTIKNMNPLIDASTVDSNGDGVSDDQALYWGYSPMVNVNSIDITKSPKIFSRVQFQGFISTEKGNLPQYAIEVSNIPLVNTKAYNQNSAFFYDRFKIDPVANGEFLGPASHAAGENDVLFLVKIRSTEINEKSYWLAYRKQMIFGAGDSIKLELNQFTELRSMRWELW